MKTIGELCVTNRAPEVLRIYISFPLFLAEDFPHSAHNYQMNNDKRCGAFLVPIP
jgi:hypothetical protein